MSDAAWLIAALALSCGLVVVVIATLRYAPRRRAGRDPQGGWDSAFVSFAGDDGRHDRRLADGGFDGAAGGDGGGGGGGGD